MRGPREIRQKSSIIIKMTISKNVLPLTSPTPFRAGRVPSHFSETRNQPVFFYATFILRTTRAIGASVRSSRMSTADICYKEDDMRERMAYLILIGMLLIVVTFVLAVVGKGEYQPPPPEKQKQGSISFGEAYPGALVGAFTSLKERRA